jgi:hypothetical protein
MRALWVLVVAGAACSKSAPEAPPSEPPTPVAVRDAAAVPDAPVEPPPPPAGAEPPTRKMYVDRIDDAATFEAYSKEVGGERFAKFVLDMRTDAIYYFDVSVYPVHKDFIFGALLKKPKTKELLRIIDRNYGETKPDFMMVYLVHHLNQDIWTFAYYAGDRATPAHVKRAHERIQQTFYLADKIKFRPDSAHQEAVAKRTGLPYILNDQLYKLADYAAFNKGTAVGTLRIVPPEIPESDLTFAEDQIVVLKAPISDITPVAGIISEEFSTPLSHLNLRAKGWRIPNVGIRDAHGKLAALDGKVVFLDARDVEYTLRAATEAEIAADRTKRENRAKVTLPETDLATKDLRTLDEMRAKDDVIYGPKAGNLGEIKHARRDGFEVPAGFGVPFAYYALHLQAAGIDQTITALLADPAVQRDANLRKAKLEQLRTSIVAAPLAPELRTKLEAALAKLPENQGVFVRSSTNAEDLLTFSGAGLHDTMPNVKGLDAVCTALKQVWASTWTLRAYDARAHARIDQAKVYGAALIQVGVPATAAGVVATVHPTDPNEKRYYTVNAKSGIGIAVVDGGKVPESLIVGWQNHGVRVLSRSDEDKRLVFDERGGVREVPNPNKGKPVLTDARALHLARVAKDLTRLFDNDKLDIEWVYVGNQLYIVQSRPLVGL